MLNLDTHILVFALVGNLRSRERALLEENEWSMSGVVPWELAKLVQLGRVEVDVHSGWTSSGRTWPSEGGRLALQRAARRAEHLWHLQGGRT